MLLPLSYQVGSNETICVNIIKGDCFRYSCEQFGLYEAKLKRENLLDLISGDLGRNDENESFIPVVTVFIGKKKVSNYKFFVEDMLKYF